MNMVPPIRWCNVDTVAVRASAYSRVRRNKDSEKTLQSMLNTFKLSSTDIVLSLMSQDENQPVQMLKRGIKRPRKRKNWIT